MRRNRQQEFSRRKGTVPELFRDGSACISSPNLLD